MSTVSKHLILIMTGISLMAACTEEPRPRSTTELLENPIILEAVMVRCSQDRQATRYDAECVNARQAVGQIEAKEEAARRVEFEARSESKRQALRRTQAAAAQARRRVSEAERLRSEAEYLAQFGVVPPSEGQSSEEEVEMDNTPLAVIPEGEQRTELSTGPGDALPAVDGGNAPVIAAEPEDETPVSDLESIRDELQRRNEEGNN